MIANILIPVAAMAVLGIIFGVGLAYALKLFGIDVDPKIFAILSKLPGSNCGACGRAGCSGFAEALSKGEAIPSGCAVSSEDARMAIAEIMGVDHSVKVKTVATLLCNGGNRAKNKYAYRGIKSCKAAALIFGGQKACAFGCLGFADCVEACPFDAIKMDREGLPEVDEAKCTSCGKCLKACPKNLFVLVEAEKRHYVKCSSKDTGAVVMKVCGFGCIGCKKCEKVCPKQAIKVESNLSAIDYKKCDNTGKCVAECPTKVIIKKGQ